jgi:hypothetical protein
MAEERMNSRIRRRLQRMARAAAPWLLAAGSAACEAARDEPNAEARPADAPAAQEPRLLGAADGIVAFLQGSVPLDTSLLADTVTLYVAPEGGGESRPVPRGELGEPARWRVGTYPFAPPPGATEVERRAGRHFNCREYDLATRYPELARLPHVGVRLAPPGSASCLQVWNLTLVFAADSARPALVAAVYDQWEW